MRRLTIAALLLVAVTSCAKDDSSGGSDSLAVSFTTSISSRVSGTEWETGDMIGIMVTSNNSILTDYRYNNLHNVTFTDPKQGIFTAATELDQIYYSVDESVMIDFYAYYPYSDELVAEDECYPIDITDQSTPTKIDFMEASTLGSGGYNKLSDDVALEFSRNMSKITLILNPNDGVELSDITAVRLEGFSTEAIYDFTTNKFRDFSGYDTDTITPYYVGENTYSAIVIPEEATNHKVYFETKNYGDIPLDITDSKFDLDKGEHISLTVKISQTAASYTENDIYGWEDITIDPDDSTFETE